MNRWKSWSQSVNLLRGSNVRWLLRRSADRCTIIIIITIITINTIIVEAVTEKLRRIETACQGGGARVQRGCGAAVQDGERESLRTSCRGGVLAPGGRG